MPSARVGTARPSMPSPSGVCRHSALCSTPVAHFPPPDKNEPGDQRVLVVSAAPTPPPCPVACLLLTPCLPAPVPVLLPIGGPELPYPARAMAPTQTRDIAAPALAPTPTAAAMPAPACIPACRCCAAALRSSEDVRATRVSIVNRGEMGCATGCVIRHFVTHWASDATK